MTLERNNSPDEKTHFGYKEVPRQEKAGKVREIFDEVAPHYNLMNDLMSFGLHRLWKIMTVELAKVRPHQRILDLAGGTGDLAKLFFKKLDKKGQIVIADINVNMLKTGRDRLINEGLIENITYLQANAECLPFSENTFHCITIAFGLRNVTDPCLALKSMARCLKPGGQCFVLEFSKPILPGLAFLYDFYSFRVIPYLGKWVTGSKESYQYLVESIRKHPNQAQLKEQMLASGFDAVKVQNFAGGIVALHQGLKY